MPDRKCWMNATVKALLWSCASLGCSALLLGSAQAFAAEGQSLTWEGKRLALSVNFDGSFALAEQARGRTWQFAAFKDAIVKSVTQRDRGCTVQFSYNGSPYTLLFAVSADESSVMLKLKGDATADFSGFRYPFCTSVGDYLVAPAARGC